MQCAPTDKQYHRPHRFRGHMQCAPLRTTYEVVGGLLSSEHLDERSAAIYYLRLSINAFALTNVSSYSCSGLEYAVMPPPA